MSRRILSLYQLAAGLSDTSTGVLLLVAPAWTLHLMGITLAPTPIAFASFVGVFVLSVGLSYLLVLAAYPPAATTEVTWRTQWQLTALIRGLVALFLVAEIASGHMESRWLVVAASDAALALIQLFGLARGWLLRA